MFVCSVMGDGVSVLLQYCVIVLTRTASRGILVARCMADGYRSKGFCAGSADGVGDTLPP